MIMEVLGNDVLLWCDCFIRSAHIEIKALQNKEKHKDIYIEI